MTKISNPHDSFFRLLLSSKEIAIAFFDYFLPVDLKEKLDLRCLEMIKDSYINRNLSNRFADLVFSCKTTFDSQVNISILLEHKSEVVNKPHIQLGEYIFNGYKLQITQKQKLSTIIPVIFYHGDERWKVEPMTSYFKETPEEALSFIPNFEYLLIDLQQFENEQLKAIRLAFLSNALLTFKNHKNNEFIISELSNMLSILPSETDRNFLRAFILYILTLVPIEQDEIIEITNKIPSHMSSEFISAAERLRQEGRKEGKLEGIQEGKKEGRQETLENIILRMLIKQNSVEAIAQLLDIEVQFVQKVADQAKS